MAYLSRETVKWLRVWLERSGIGEGAIFRRLIGRTQVGGALSPGSIAPIFKRVAQWIGMPARSVASICEEDQHPAAVPQASEPPRSASTLS